MKGTSHPLANAGERERRPFLRGLVRPFAHTDRRRLRFGCLAGLGVMRVRRLAGCGGERGGGSLVAPWRSPLAALRV